MKFYNTLSQSKDEFTPLNKDEIKIYSCGPTVYDYFHIGNARPFIVFDTLRRFLEYKGNIVNFVQNFTDIDDKIINRAKDEGVDPIQISERFIKEYFNDASSLNIKKATHHPKVTENIKEIIDMIKTLIDKGYAYESQGDIYYSARKFLEYGKLSKKNIDDLESGARVDVNESKEDPLDFALWKKAKEGEVSWDSPWGKGRPGWHIECSVMSKKFLGDTIDIHGGGADLIFPHHENEIAQSEAANEKKFANFFMHNGYINIDGKKMSKSLGNFWTVRDILKHFSGNTIRFFVLSSHYRSPINFSEELLESANKSLERIHECLSNLSKINNPSGKAFEDELSKMKDEFLIALEDDLNTAKAISTIFTFVTFLNKNMDDLNTNFAQSSKDLIIELLDVLGIVIDLQEQVELSDEVKQILAERKTARENKDFAKSDELRDKLKSMGIIVKDGKEGQSISYDK